MHIMHICSPSPYLVCCFSFVSSLSLPLSLSRALSSRRDFLRCDDVSSPSCRSCPSFASSFFRASFPLSFSLSCAVSSYAYAGASERVSGRTDLVQPPLRREDGDVPVIAGARSAAHFQRGKKRKMRKEETRAWERSTTSCVRACAVPLKQQTMQLIPQALRR